MHASRSHPPRILIPMLMAFVFAATSSAGADLFDPPWVGYNAGESAFPGNGDPFERDPTAMVTADFDGDGSLDVAIANYEFLSPGGGTDGLSGFAVLFNHGDGTYSEPSHTTVSNKGCWDIVAADFDEDADLDIAVTISDAYFEGQSIRVYFNDGDGLFPTFRTLSAVDGPMGITTADFNGDTHLDLAVANYRWLSESGEISVYMGDGAGGFASQVLYTVGWRPFKLEAADLDGVNGPDLAIAHEGQRVTILHNEGDGTFGTEQVHGSFFPMQGGMYYGCLVLADTDQDGDLDIFYGNTRSHPLNQSGKIVHLRNSGGTFTRQMDIPLVPYSAGPVDFAAGDIDGDEWPDLVAVHHSGRSGDGPQIVLNDGMGGFLPAEPIPAGQGTFAAELEDVDGDGDLDLLTADRYSMMLTVHENTGSEIPRLATLYETATINIRMDVGDADGDGDLDVVTSTESTGDAGAFLRNNGDGTFEAPVLYTHSEQYGRGVARGKLRDLDNDGDLDLLYNDAHTDAFPSYDFYVGLNDGTGAFGPLVEWPQGTCGNGDIDAFDLDEDGDLDVVNLEELACAGGFGGNRLFINLNRGDATFDPPYTIEISTGPHTIVGGDFNEDGHVDLASAHWMPYGRRDFINVHLGNGDGTLQEEVVYEVGQGPRWIVSADFNGDQHADLATANSGDGDAGRETLTVLMGTGTGTFEDRADYYAPYSPDLLGVSGLAHGDLDGDGDLDLFMTTVAGGVAVYRNDGTGGFMVEPRLGLFWDPWSVMFADMTNDGIPDLVAVTNDGQTPLGRSVAVLPGTAGAASIQEQESPWSRATGAAGIQLSPAIPNPFGDSAWLTLELAETQELRAALYDAGGRMIRLLHQGVLEAGTKHRLRLARADLSNGIYFVRVEAGDASATRKVQIVK